MNWKHDWVFIVVLLVLSFIAGASVLSHFAKQRECKTYFQCAHKYVPYWDNVYDKCVCSFPAIQKGK